MLYRSLLWTLRFLCLYHLLLGHGSDNEYSSAYVLMSFAAAFHLTTNSWPPRHDCLLSTASNFVCYFMMFFPVVLNVACISITTSTCLSSCCLAPAVYSGSSILPFRCHVTVSCRGDWNLESWVWSFKFSHSLKRNINMWIWILPRGARNVNVTRGTISVICCHLSGFCLRFVGLWAHRSHKPCAHTCKELMQGLCVISIGLAKRFAAGSQMPCLGNVSQVCNHWFGQEHYCYCLWDAAFVSVLNTSHKQNF